MAIKSWILQRITAVLIIPVIIYFVSYFMNINTHHAYEKFRKIGIEKEINVVFSCGSGITATVLALAYSLINDKYLPTIYDGSWAEYGKIK